MLYTWATTIKKKSVSFQNGTTEFELKICKLRHAQCYWSLLYYFILFIRPMCSRIFKKNVCIMVHSRNIYVDIFLIDPIFILQIIYCCTGCLSRWYEIWIQATFFSHRPRCKRIQIANFKSDETRAKSTFSKAHSAAASGHSAELIDVAMENIMKMVSLSFA